MTTLRPIASQMECLRNVSNGGLRMTRASRTVGAVAAMLSISAAHASIVQHANFDSWAADVGSYTTLDFIDLPNLTVVTDQYAHLGPTFGNALKQIHPNFPIDGHGLLGILLQPISIDFDAPRHALSLFGAGSGLVVWVEMDGVVLDIVVAVPGPFIGFVSDQPFDRVRVLGTSGGIRIDNLYFGAPIPAPGALGLLALAGFAGPRRRRGE